MKNLLPLSPRFVVTELVWAGASKRESTVTVQTKQGEILNEKSSSINHWKWSIA
jgi:hypothetical protein